MAVEAVQRDGLGFAEQFPEQCAGHPFAPAEPMPRVSRVLHVRSLEPQGGELRKLLALTKKSNGDPTRAHRTEILLEQTGDKLPTEGDF